MQEPRNDFERALVMAGVSATFQAELLKRNDFVDRLKQQRMNFSSIEEAFLRNLSPEQIDVVGRTVCQSLDSKELAWYAAEAYKMLAGKQRTLPPMMAPAQDERPVKTRGISPDMPLLTLGHSSRR